MAKRTRKGRFGVRGADYKPPLGRSLPSSFDDFSISAKGFSFTFSHNFKGWKTFTKEMKLKVLEAALAEIKETVRKVGRGAIARAPHYSGALEHSIKVTVPEITGLGGYGRMTAVVGVLSSWKSSYDEIAAKLGFPQSSPELVTYIHEHYDDFIQDAEHGYKRKRRKESVVGQRVGSRFLTRAWYDIEQSNNLAKGIAKRIFSVNPAINESSINSELDQFASSLDGKLNE